MPSSHLRHICHDDANDEDDGLNSSIAHDQRDDEEDGANGDGDGCDEVDKLADLRERCTKKKSKKKLTSVSFVYVCVGRNGHMLVFFWIFSPNNSLIDNSLSE